MNPLPLLAVGEHSYGAEGYSEQEEGEEVGCQLGKGGAFEIDGPHDTHKPAGRESDGNPLCPLRHRLQRRKHSAHQHENHHKKEEHEDALLHSVADIGHGDGKSRHGEGE